MTSLLTVKKEVEQLKQTVGPKPKDELWIGCMFPWDRTKPHGKYGHQKLEIYSRKYEAFSEEELKLLKEAYAEIPDKVKKRTNYWNTWKNFLEYHRCKCPLHKEIREAEQKRKVKQT